MAIAECKRIYGGGFSVRQFYQKYIRKISQAFANEPNASCKGGGGVPFPEDTLTRWRILQALLIQ